MGKVIRKKRRTKERETTKRHRAVRFRQRGYLTAVGRRSSGATLAVAMARGPGRPQRCREHRPLCVPGRNTCRAEHHVPGDCAHERRPRLLPSPLGPSGLSWLPRRHHPGQLCTQPGLLAKGSPRKDSVMHPLLARTLRTAFEKPVSSSQAENPAGAKSKWPQHQFHTSEEARDKRAALGSEGEAECMRARTRTRTHRHTHKSFWNELAGT